MRPYLTTICAHVEQQLMIPEDLQRIPNGEIFAVRYMQGNFFDYMGTYLFIAKKGGIEDWAIYGIAVMTDKEYIDHPHINPKFLFNMPTETLIEKCRRVGNKLNDEDNIRLIVPCTDELLKQYRR